MSAFRNRKHGVAHYIAHAGESAGLIAMVRRWFADVTARIEREKGK